MRYGERDVDPVRVEAALPILGARVVCGIKCGALEAGGGVVGAKCAQRVLLVFRVPGRRLVDVLLFCMHFSGSCHLSVTSL